MQRCYCTSVLLGMLVLVAFDVRAQNDEPPEIKGKFQLNTFRPASTPNDGFVLDHAEVSGALDFGVGASVQIDDDPLTWQRENEDGSYKTIEVVSERLIVAHLAAALGLFDYGEIALHFPIYLDNGIGKDTAGVGDLFLIPKGAYRFSVSKAELGLSLLVPLSFPTGDAKNLLGEDGVSVAPTLAVDFLLAKLRILLNLGFRWREEVETEMVRGSEFLLGLGAELDLVRNPGVLRLTAELDLATQTSDFFGRFSTPVVLLVGLKHRFDNGFGLFGAGGAGVTPSVGSPDFRMVFGVDFVLKKKRDRSMKKGDEIVSEDGQAGKDRDGDGILDENDYCPNEAEDFDGTEDDDGCPEFDNDGDGVPDSKDQCPNTPENFNNQDDEDGCPEIDSDGDGVFDTLDVCQSDMEDIDGWEDNDGCPDPDNDLDGILDAEDKCPNLPQVSGDEMDGCPLYIEVSPDNQIVFKRPIRFERGTANLNENSFEVIDELAAAIIANPLWEEVDIYVHMSGRGNMEANQEISDQRAMAILRLLVAAGVLPERLVAVGKGNTEPIASADTPEGRKQNTRVEVRVHKGATP